MKVDEEDRKLFAGGLPQDCTQEDLQEYFGNYGEIERVQLKMDPTTGRSRGFAFVLFAEASSLDAATSQQHTIKGKTATVKKADVKPGKIYLGKIPETDVTEEDIRAYFSDFGVITEFIRPIDKMKNNEPKNFCFITFEKERVSKKLVMQGSAMINGHKLLVKEVNPNPRDPNARGGMRGGARGGYGGSAWDQGYGAAGGYGGGWGADQGGYGGGWGADQSGYGGYGAAAAGGYDGGYGGYGGGYGGPQGGMGGGGKMRGGPRGGGMGGGRGAGRGRGRGAPY